jgi:hypothetical protein
MNENTSQTLMERIIASCTAESHRRGSGLGANIRRETKRLAKLGHGAVTRPLTLEASI